MDDLFPGLDSEQPIPPLGSYINALGDQASTRLLVVLARDRYYERIGARLLADISASPMWSQPPSQADIMRTTSAGPVKTPSGSSSSSSSRTPSGR